MNDWVSHPITQSIIAPFVAAFITAKLLNHLRLSGLAVIAGFCSTVYLVAGFNFESLSSIRKIILSGLIAAVIGLFFDLISSNQKSIHYLFAIACSIVGLWMSWPILQQKEILEATVYGIGIVIYMMWITILVDNLATKPARAGSAGMSLGIGIGVSASLSSSAVLGQLGLSIGVACSAYLIAQVISRKPYPCGKTLTLPISMLCGLIMLAAIILSQMPWYCLPIVAVIPLVAHIPLPKIWSLRKQIVVLSILTLIIAALTVSITLMQFQ